MRAFIIKTPEFSTTLYDEVCELLTKENIYSNDSIIFTKVKYPIEVDNDKTNRTISRKELYSICLDFRNLNTVTSIKKNKEEVLVIDDDDAVIVLTSRRDEYNWFSHFDLSHNIFVTTYGITDICEEIQEKFYCAYEVCTNILQDAMKLDVEDENYEPYIHINPKGCMNDMCGSKDQIRLKMMSTNICKSCYQKIQEMGIPSIAIEQAKSIFEKVRLGIITKTELDKTELSNIVFDKYHGTLYLEESGIVIKISTLPKTIYAFLMSHPHGLSFHAFCQSKHEMSILYGKENVKSINTLLNPDKPKLFYNNITLINTQISQQIVSPFDKLYHIVNDGLKYKINLPIDKIIVTDSRPSPKKK